MRTYVLYVRIHVVRRPMNEGRYTDVFERKEADLEAPTRVAARESGDYLAVMAKAIFQSGISWNVVESKWAGIQSAFHGFDTARVADMNVNEIDELANDARVIRHRKKLEAIVHNAGEILEIEREHGNFRDYLRSHADFEAAVRSLRKRFKYLGETGCYYFLYIVGENVPPHDEWALSRGVKFSA